MAGVLRVLFFLAVAVLGITAVVSGVTTLYDPPSGGENGEFEGLNGFESFGPDQDTADYNRNVGLIVGLVGAAVSTAGLLGLGSRFNTLRAGLLAGGVGLVLAGVGFGSSGSDDWLTFLTSGLALAGLLVSSLWLDDGLPVKWGARPPATGGQTPGWP
jgi:hypothetical protein